MRKKLMGLLLIRFLYSGFVHLRGFLALHFCEALEVVTGAAYGRATQVAAADEFVSCLLPVVLAIRQTGAKTPEAMSQAPNQRGIRMARGGAWRASLFANLFARARKTAALQESLL
jgi:hypothetical protein